MAPVPIGDHFASILAELDAVATGQPTMRWLIKELEVGSAEVGLEATPINPLYDRSAYVVNQFASGMTTYLSVPLRGANESRPTPPRSCIRR